MKTGNVNNALTHLLNLEIEEKRRKGLLFTPAEIAGQVELWPTTFQRFSESLPQISSFLKGFLAEEKKCVVCTGAGTSEYIGYCIEGLLRRNLGLPVNVVSTTKIVTHPQDVFIPGYAVLLISFARSGNSPESLGAVRIAEQLPDPVYHLVLTSNPRGELIQAAAGLRRCLTLVLDERTNDQGLAMTGAFTNLVLAAQMLAHAFCFEEYGQLFPRIVEGGRALLNGAPNVIAELSRLEFERAVFLGDGAAFGTAVESRLKLQELTAGKVMCAYESFPGLRHGPEAVINNRTLVVAFLSSDAFARRYELDLLEELREKRIGRAVLAVGDQAADIGKLAEYRIEYDMRQTLNVPDEATPPIQVMAGQLLGLFKSLEVGLKPDNPSEEGIIHRVVEGVKVYDPVAFRRSGRHEIMAQR